MNLKQSLIAYLRDGVASVVPADYRLDYFAADVIALPDMEMVDRGGGVFEYGQAAPWTEDAAAGEAVYANYTDDPAIMHLSVQNSSLANQQYSWRLTNEFNMGTDLTVGINVPGYGGMGIELTDNVRVGTERNFSFNKLQSWVTNFGAEIPVPGQSIVLAKILVKREILNGVRFQMRARLSGSVGLTGSYRVSAFDGWIAFDQPIPEHYVPIVDIFRRRQDLFPDFVLDGSSSIVGTVGGTLDGVASLSARIEQWKAPLKVVMEDLSKKTMETAHEVRHKIERSSVRQRFVGTPMAALVREEIEFHSLLSEIVQSKGERRTVELPTFFASQQSVKKGRHD